MSNLYKLYSNNEVMEKQGVDFVVADGVSFRFKRMGGSNSDAMKKSTAKYFKPHAQAASRNALSKKKEHEIMIKIIVESCFISMTGVKDEEGILLDSTAENCIKILCEVPDLGDTIIEYVHDGSNFREPNFSEDDGEEEESGLGKS